MKRETVEASVRKEEAMSPVPHEVDWLVRCYGFLVPAGQTWTGMKLASAIAETYCLYGPVVVAYNVAMEQIFSITRGCGDVFSVKYIVKGEVS